jgi:hypothetical protein
MKILIVYDNAYYGNSYYGNSNEWKRQCLSFLHGMVSELSLDIIESRRALDETVKNMSSIYRRK